jgi:hypothetical protein
LSRITVETVEEYRTQRRAQPTKTNPNRTIKGATVNRELECLKWKHIPETPAAAVKRFNSFNELREPPIRRMLAVEEELRILEAAPPRLRMAIILLSQTGWRTYSEGFSLRWESGGFRERAHPLGQRREDAGLGGTCSFVRVCMRSIAGIEQGTSTKSPFVFPSPHLPAAFYGQDCLEGHARYLSVDVGYIS